MFLRRRLSDLFVIQKMNEAARDIFVEGVTDKYCVRRLLAEALPFGTSIVCPDDVEIDTFLPSGVDGARGRVIEVCEYANSAGMPKTYGLVDRNFCLPEENTGLENLFYTRTADVEFDIFDASKLVQVLSDFFGKNIEAEDLDKAIEIARQIQSVRRLGWREGFGIALPKLSRVLSISHDRLKLDLDSLAQRLASANGEGNRWQTIVEEAQVLAKEMQKSGCDHFIGFHVFEEIVGYLVHNKYSVPSNLLLTDWLGRIMRGHLNLEVAQKPPFVEILKALNR